jgi:hypothetical protein
MGEPERGPGAEEDQPSSPGEPAEPAPVATNPRPSVAGRALRLVVSAAALVVFLLLASQDLLRDKVELDGHAVYYEGGVTEAEARAAGRHLQSEGFLGDVVLGTDDGLLTVSLIVQDGAWDQPTVKLAAGLWGASLSEGVFDGRPLVVRLCDTDEEVHERVEVP